MAQFARENKLNFDVLSDPTRRTCEEWGAVRGDTTARTTYIVSGRESSPITSRGWTCSSMPVMCWRCLAAPDRRTDCSTRCCCGPKCGRGSGSGDGRSTTGQQRRSHGDRRGKHWRADRAVSAGQLGSAHCSSTGGWQRARRRHRALCAAQPDRLFELGSSRGCSTCQREKNPSR